MLEREPISKYIDCKQCIKKDVCEFKERFETESVEVPVFPFLKVELKCTAFYSPFVQAPSFLMTRDGISELPKGHEKTMADR